MHIDIKLQYRIAGSKHDITADDRPNKINSQNDFPAKDSSAQSSARLSRSYTRWSPMEEGVTLAWRDVNVYVKKRREEGKGYKRIINGGTFDRFV